MNRLAAESSPYLLQHASNPVDWYPWGPEALQKAKDENKLLLISIGYSACHWCHVMEHESFENHEVAEIMNRYFISIKVDREERPDIDQVYMNAVQLMSGRGGWPLNCIALPDQRPVYGGTYFTKKDWINILLNLAKFYSEKPAEMLGYAEKLTQGIRQSELVKRAEADLSFTKDDLKTLYDGWKRNFDFTDGGQGTAPKFPMPNNFSFLLKYAHLMKDESAEIITHITLEKMAFGGIYDQLGGGFARYSVDAFWKAPHFEKMLYDNAQLISLYSEAYQQSGNSLYKEVVYDCIGFTERELCSPEYGFYSALDADSEGVEGKYYVWTKDEINTILKDDAALFCIYFNISDEGNWEEGHNILWRTKDDKVLAELLGMTVGSLMNKIHSAKEKLFRYREQRVRPGLDDKILCSWNALMLKALVDAYRVFQEDDFLTLALRNADFIQDNFIQKDYTLYRSYKNGKSSISAFLDDYAFVIDAFVELYQATFDESYLHLAQKIKAKTNEYFSDEQSAMYFYTSLKNPSLIARKQEVFDSVIPASNSVMAQVLYKLGILFDDAKDLQCSKQMLNNLREQIKHYPSSYSNWAMLALYHVFPPYELVITEDVASAFSKELDRVYLPNKFLMAAKDRSALPLTQGKTGGVSTIYVCVDKSCRLPVHSITEALQQMQENL